MAQQEQGQIWDLSRIFLAHNGLQEMALWVPSYLGLSVGPKVLRCEQG